MKSSPVRKNSFARRVLLVDHRDPVLQTLAFELRGAGSLLNVVHSDDEAVLMAKSLRPELLISKVALPVIGDLAEAIEVKRWNPECKVILLSFWEVGVDAATILKAGDFTFHLLCRPEHPAELLDQIEAVFDDRPSERLAS